MHNGSSTRWSRFVEDRPPYIDDAADYLDDAADQQMRWQVAYSIQPTFGE